MLLLAAPSHAPTPGDPAGLNWDALSAVGTLLAVLVSLVALGIQRYRDHALQRDIAAQQHRAQAGYVSVWYDNSRELLMIENRSEQPIYDVGATFLRPTPAENDPLHLPLSVGGFLPFLGPRYRAAFDPRIKPTNPAPILAFCDSQGVLWRRDASGKLIELDKPVLEYFGEEEAGSSNMVSGSPQPI